MSLDKLIISSCGPLGPIIINSAPRPPPSSPYVNYRDYRSLASSSTIKSCDLGVQFHYIVVWKEGQKGAVKLSNDLTLPNRRICFFSAPLSSASWPTKTTIYRLTVIVNWLDVTNRQSGVFMIARLRLCIAFQWNNQAMGDLDQIPVLPHPSFFIYFYFFYFFTFFLFVFPFPDEQTKFHLFRSSPQFNKFNRQFTVP